jgi:membrane-associated phospholipid phosphatase
MPNPDIYMKFRWLVFPILGACFMFSPNWAEAIPEAPDLEYFSTGSLASEKGFGRKSLTGGPRLAQNKRHASTLRKRGNQASLRGKTKLDGNYFKGIFTDTGYILTSPLRWDSSDWATASIVAGVTGIFFALDDEIQEEFQDRRSSTTDDLSKIFEPFGNGAITLPTLIGFYIYGNLGENEKVERTALLAVESFLVTGFFSNALKLVTGRPRPSKGEPSDTFGDYSSGSKSFPSGHTITAFAIATVVANEYEDVPFVAPISYGLATLTGLSRINDNKHWASDVFFSAALGYFTSKTILKLHSNKKGRHFTIYPRFDYRGGGLVLSSRF